MTTDIATLDPTDPEPGIIARAAELIRAGRLVAFPTETVYGLGASALDAAAVRGIFLAKGRPPSNPVIVHLFDSTGVAKVASAWPETAERLAARFWPGPLTIVVPRSDTLPAEVTAGGATVAVRCPAHPVAQALIRAAGVPIAAPSANRSTELSPTRAEHVMKSLAGRIDLVLDAGPCPGGIESTVVDVTGSAVVLLRRGQITAAMLEVVAGPVTLRSAAGEIARSPGLMAKHYSPHTPLRLVDRGNLERAAVEARAAGITVGTLPLPADHITAERELYSSLHALDAWGLELILAELPPDAPEWAAVRDRLQRAAVPS